MPVTPFYCARGLFRDVMPERTVLYVSCLLGMSLLLSQMRPNYLRSFAPRMPVLMMSSEAQQFPPKARIALPFVATVLFALAYWVPATYRLLMRPLPANEPNYSFTRLALPALAEACREDPGIVLVNNNDGHYVRCHTECSVIPNNLLVTPQQEAKALLTTHLLGMTPAELSRMDLPVKYVLVRASGLLVSSPDGRYCSATKDMAQPVAGTLFAEMLLPQNDEQFGGWISLQGWRMPREGNYVFMRLLKRQPEPLPQLP